MHIIGGLPRSGSTLFCNILNQNEAIYASHTSILPMLLLNLINTWSNSVEFKGALREKEVEEARIQRVAQSVCFSWYAEHLGEKIVFDKSRAWNSNLLALRSIFPQSKAVIIVRDLRDAFASIEKQHRRNGLLDETVGPAKQMRHRAEGIFSPTGLIGGPLGGVRDIIERELDVMFIRYEDLILKPEAVLQMFYAYLGVQEIAMNHNFDNIVNTAKDPDNLYLYKYPHVGDGKLNRQLKKDGWRDYMSEQFGADIIETHRWFFDYFNYEV